MVMRHVATKDRSANKNEEVFPSKHALVGGRGRRRGYGLELSQKLKT